MADDPSSQASGDPNPSKTGHDNPTLKSDSVSVSVPSPPSQSQPQSTPEANPNPVSQPAVAVPSYTLPPPPQISASSAAMLPPATSFRPPSQFVNFQNPGLSPGVPPPGVTSTAMAPLGSFPPMSHYHVTPGQAPNPAMRPFAHMPNGYVPMPGVAPQAAVPPMGLPRYPSPYTMVRPGFPLRPPGAIGTLPVVPRPPGMQGVRPIMPPVRPAVIPSVTPADKPQTTVYVGKIAPTVDNDFMLSLLQLCGSVKSGIRALDPTTGIPKGFGFYEFESVEGVLRAIRLLSKFSIDGQELMLNVNEATKKYLEGYVKKKMENAKIAKESEREGSKDIQPAVTQEHSDKKNESPSLSSDESKKDGETGNKENTGIAFSGFVTDEDREVDREVLEKIKNAVQERAKNKPLPPPPPPPFADGSGPGSASISKDGNYDADVVGGEASERRNNDETPSEPNRPETSSPDRSRQHDRRSRDRERDRDRSREKEQELDRYEREAERERARKEREQRRKMEDAERAYQARVRQWERRERDKEKERQYEKEREKEKERKRKKEVRYDEDEDDDDSSRRRWHRSALEEKRRLRLREKDDDLADRLKEEAEIAEAKRKAEEEKLQQQQIDALRLLSAKTINGSEKVQALENKGEGIDIFQDEGDSICENHSSDGFLRNGTDNESAMAVDNASDTRQSGNAAQAKKLGFGLAGSGKRTSVPSVFNEDEDEMHKDKKMRPLVPIEYSTEEQQAVQQASSGTTPPHLAAAQEFAKRISNVNPKTETFEVEKEKSRRYRDNGSRRDRDRVDGENGLRKDREHGEKAKTPDNKKLLDAKQKQLIDAIPRTKDELFSYEIDWAIYDKHQLHERLKPWVSKKIMEFLGEEEATLVDYIVSNTKEHVKAPQMLELLKVILEDEAEMFVLKMWRMLIYEIKRVEAGLPVKSKT